MAEKNDKPSETTTPTTSGAGMTLDAEASYKLQIDRLARENKLLADELSAYKSLEKDRDEAAKSAKAKKDAGITTEPRALTPMIGNGRRTIVPGDVLFADEIVGLERGKHYEFAPVG